MIEEKTKWRWTDQRLIYNFLCEHDTGWTSQEIEREIGRVGAHRRLSEVAKMGLARKSGSKICSVTGKKSALWWKDDSPPKPKPIKKPITHELKVLRARIGVLESENEQYKVQVMQLKLILKGLGKYE